MSFRPSPEQIKSRYDTFLDLYEELCGDPSPDQSSFIRLMAEYYEHQGNYIKFYKRELKEVFEELRKLKEIP